MEFKILVSVVLGTMLSAVIGYVYTYRKDIFSSFETKIGNGGTFDKLFNRLINVKKAQIKTTDNRKDTRSAIYKNSFTASKKNQTSWDILLKNAMGNSLKEKNIKALQKFIENLSSTNSSFIKNWAKSLKVSGGEVRLLKVARTLNLDHAFIKDQNVGDVYTISEIEMMVKSYALLEIYVEEAKNGKLELLLEICKKKKVHASYGIKAIEMMVLQKCGGSTVGIMTNFASKILENSLRLKSLNHGKLHNAFMELVKLGGPLVIQKNLQALITKIILFESEHKKKEQEKAQKSQSKFNKGKKSLGSFSEYYSILGVADNANFDTVKKAYKKIAMQKHPDFLMSKNLSPDEMKKAHNEYLKIKTAFDKIESLNKKKVA